MNITKSVTGLCVFSAFTLSSAQGARAQDDVFDFTGPSLGVEAGIVEHHYYIEESFPQSDQADGKYYRSFGPGGGVFLGYDIPIGANLILGGEASLVIGGADNSADFADGSFVRAKPRYGYRIVGRIGRKMTDRSLLYATFGYGSHKYRITAAGVDNVKATGHSFVVGAGGEYRLSKAIGVRLDFRHLDNQSNQLLIGLPVRF
ncbi:outer membrane protein [Novosphingopyxis sp.]|uniref:outer membrane protein n=1 Tax=Novosphingopyxis sp. TaxID=2709690 RepID=UPI003B5C4AFC